MELGERIRVFRRLREVSQQELAFGMKMAPSQLCRYETGISKPSLAVLMRIAAALNVSLEEFFR